MILSCVYVVVFVLNNLFIIQLPHDNQLNYFGDQCCVLFGSLLSLLLGGNQMQNCRL